MGLVVHAMAGFDADQAEEALSMPDHFDALCMVAVGHPGDPMDLSEDLRVEPSSRMSVEDVSIRGSYQD